MNETPNLLSPERLAEIRAKVAECRSLKQEYPGWDAGELSDELSDLLTAYDAQREQFRQVLESLLRQPCTPGTGATGDYATGVNEARGTHNAAIRRAAASLGIDL